MPNQHLFRPHLGFAALLMGLLLFACGTDDRRRGETPGPAPTGDAGVTDATMVDTAPMADSGTPPPSPSCNGDWTLGSVPFSDSSAGIGHACEGSPPMNCRDGSYIQMADGQCICLLSCSSLTNPRIGANCTMDGSWTCQRIQATNASANSGNLCVHADMNLCGASTEPPDPGPGPGPSCLPTGGACEDDEDCCSEDCSFDECSE